MLKENWRLVSYVSRITDNLIIVAAFFGAYYLRDYFLESILRTANFLKEIYPAFDLTSLNLHSLGPISDYTIILFISIPLFNFTLSSLGAYRSMRFCSWRVLFKTVGLSSALVFLCTSALLFVLKQDLSRLFLFSFCSLFLFMLFFERLMVLGFLKYVRMRGRNFRNLLIVGTGKQADKLKEDISSMPELGVVVRGFVDISSSKNAAILKKVSGSREEFVSSSSSVIADADSFERTLKRQAIDEVLFTDIEENPSVVKELASLAAEEGVSVSFTASLFGLDLAKTDISYFGATPLIHYQASPASIGPLFLKRLLDICLSFLCLIIFSPIMFFVAVLIKSESKGPIFFKQKRVGLNGRIFTLLKFRSMQDKAQRQLKSLKGLNEMTGPVFKIKNDPRVTKIGRFIRKYSLDELPQLLNVLFGDMSLVGPRPPLPREVVRYSRKHRRRLSMRPGITCTWQVSGRNNIPCFEEWTELDLAYIDNWSLLRDLSLLLKTIPVVLSGRGAN